MPPQIENNQGRMNGNELYSVASFSMSPFDGEFRIKTESEVRRERIGRNLVRLYGEERGLKTFRNIFNIFEDARGSIPEHKPKHPGQRFHQDDRILITFPHQLQDGDTPIQNHMRVNDETLEWRGEPTLRTLRRFLNTHVKDAVNIVHVLPFNKVNKKWADRGFSQVDRSVVQEEYGAWQDVAAVGEEHELMVDIIVGHLDIDSPEFKAYQARHPRYKNYFVGYKPEELDQEYEYKGKTKKVKEWIKGIRRPRTHDWLTEFPTADGPRMVVTTFSKRQADLNWREPAVLEDGIRTIVKNLQHNARIFRIDAITYMTKQLGTESANEPENYIILEILKDFLAEASPDAKIITETNVPFEENISYFGNGENGADAVYGFENPFTFLDAFRRGKANHLYTLLERRRNVPNPQKNTWDNIYSTHDGMGTKGVVGLLADDEIEGVIQQIVDNRGRVSYGTLNGEQSVYEANTTGWSALNGHITDFGTALRRRVAVQRLLNSIPGIPSDYLPDLLGMENYQDPFQNQDNLNNRDINEQKLDYAEIDRQLQDANSRMAQIFTALTRVNKERRQYSAFNPVAPCEPLKYLDPTERVFAFRRGGPDETNVLSLINVSGDEMSITWDGVDHQLAPYEGKWVPISPGSSREDVLYTAA